MRVYTRQWCEIKCVTSITCDICGDIHDNEVSLLHCKQTFGYEAQYFSDMDTLSIDIYEKCLYTFLQEKDLLKKCIEPYYKEEVFIMCYVKQAKGVKNLIYSSLK